MNAIYSIQLKASMRNILESTTKCYKINVAWQILSLPITYFTILEVITMFVKSYKIKQWGNFFKQISMKTRNVNDVFHQSWMKDKGAEVKIIWGFLRRRYTNIEIQIPDATAYLRALRILWTLTLIAKMIHLYKRNQKF